MTETVGSSAWLRRVFEEEARDDLFAGHAPQEQPVLVLLGGQPAAGKTRAQHAILAEHEDVGHYSALHLTNEASNFKQ